MEELIEALQILAKYSQPKYPTQCLGDILYVVVNPDLVSADDKQRLAELGLFPSPDELDCFYSFRFGSA